MGQVRDYDVLNGLMVEALSSGGGHPAGLAKGPRWP